MSAGRVRVTCDGELINPGIRSYFDILHVVSPNVNSIHHSEWLPISVFGSVSAKITCLSPTLPISFLPVNSNWSFWRTGKCSRRGSPRFRRVRRRNCEESISLGRPQATVSRFSTAHSSTRCIYQRADRSGIQKSY